MMGCIVGNKDTRERRKVQLVEQLGHKTTGRSSQVSKSFPSTQGRPLSADDIQKAKQQAQFLQSKYGTKCSPSNESSQLLPESSSECTASATFLLSAPKATTQPKAEDEKKRAEDDKKSDTLPCAVVNKQKFLDSKLVLDSEEPLWKRCKRVQISWKTPPVMDIDASWTVVNGENSKEVDVQKNRNRREREIVYRSLHEIPSDPKEPWDCEMDYDDSLTPEIPIEQLPDVDGAENIVSPCEDGETAVPPASTSSQNGGGNAAEPDLELLAALLKNPDLVFALTSGQAGNLSSEEIVKFLDMIKAKELNSVGSVTGVGRQAEKVEVSLPSPTPSSDPVTSGWKNSFSRQTVASGEGRDALGYHSQENAANSSLMQLQTPHSIYGRQLAPETALQATMVQPSALVLENGTPPLPSSHHVSLLNSSSSLLSASEFNARNIPVSNLALPNLVGTSERHTALPLHQSRTPTPSYAQDPLLSDSWSDRQRFDAASYHHGNINQRNYDNVGGPMPPRSWDRYEAVNRTEFESWSPGNSPARSREHLPHRDYTAPRMNLGQNYRQERTLARNPAYPSSSGYSPDPNRGGDRWRRDRRR